MHMPLLSEVVPMLVAVPLNYIQSRTKLIINDEHACSLVLISITLRQSFVMPRARCNHYPYTTHAQRKHYASKSFLPAKFVRSVILTKPSISPNCGVVNAPPTLLILR